MNVSFGQRCLLWLSSAEISSRRVRELSKAYHGPEGIWESFGSAQGPAFQPGSRATLERLHSDAAMEDLLARHDRMNVRLLFLSDSDYPPLLRAIDDPPYLLYCAGKPEALTLPCVAIVGTRMPSAYGEEVAGVLARGLSRAGVCVVSGLARGIDSAAHKGALSVDGHTAGVLGSGINVPYPPEHTPMLRKIAGGIGVVLSEYPLDAEPVTYHFPHRNRVISGLSLGVVFVEGKVKSGGMLTVGTALSQGREVFAVPGRVGASFSEGPHAILREGARIVTSAEDILEDLGLCAQPAFVTEAKESERLTSAQGSILQCLRAEPLTPEELSRRLGQRPEQLIEELGMLEVLGMVRREAGNRYAVPLRAGQGG